MTADLIASKLLDIGSYTLQPKDNKNVPKVLMILNKLGYSVHKITNTLYLNK